MSEEDVKSKIILPWIKDLGISIDELSFETKFSLRLGKSIHQIKGKKSKKFALGYSDILVKKGDQNLFIIEVKDLDIKISDEDIQQAISYSKLLHPIAPFSIITNGKTTKIYDSITQEDITNKNISECSKYWKNGLKLSVEEELEQRFLGIQNFIGYSKENLEVFSKSQVDLRILSLKGNKDNLSKKYIPELYLHNEKINSEFQNYLSTDKQCFAIIGEAGIGKTNLICSLSEANLSKNLVFFFNGTELIRDIITSIKDDCNWFFSTHLQAEEVLKRLVQLTKSERKLLIFIDAIDEVSISNFILEFNELIKKILKYSNIKLCVSCKINEWDKFLNIKGNPSSICDTIYHPHNNDNRRKDIPGIYVERFNDLELEKLDQLYRSLFNYRGTLKHNIKNELRLGLTLRIFASVYSNKQVPDTFNDIKMFEEYLKIILEKIDYEKALNFLIEIAKVILEENKDTTLFHLTVGNVDEILLRKRLNLSPNDNLYPELFSYNILIRVNQEDGNNFITFYFGKLRNYIIALKVLKLQNLSSYEFKNKIEELINNSIGREALLWYYQISKSEHKEVLQEFYYVKALLFVNEYERLLNKYFYVIKDQFDPYTKGEIGLVINKIIYEGGRSYGFFPLTHNQEKLKLFDGSLYYINHPSLLELKIKNIQTSGSDFLNNDPYNEATVLIKEKLEKIIFDGELFEDESEDILKEKVLAIIYNYYEEINIELKIRNYSLLNLIEDLPINLDDILKKIKLKFAERYYEDLFIENNIRNGVFNLTIDRKIIKEKALDALKRNLDIPDPKVSGKVPPFGVLKDSIMILKEHFRCMEINEHVLPTPDISYRESQKILSEKQKRTNYIPDVILSQFSNERLKEYFEIFFSKFLEVYKKLIEINFSGLEDSFTLYKKLPVLVRCQIFLDQEWIPLSYGIKEIEGSSKVIVEINPKDLIDWREYRVTSQLTSDILRNTRPVDLVSNSIFEKAREHCPLRNFIYNWILDEYRSIKNNLKYT